MFGRYSVLAALLLVMSPWAQARASLPERLIQSDPRSTEAYLASYRQDWADDLRLRGTQVPRACRGVGKQAREVTLDVPALGLVPELPRFLEPRRLLDPRGLDLGLRKALVEFSVSAGVLGFDESEKRSFSELFSTRAVDRLGLLERVIESQWLLVRVADRQYGERISELLERGGTRVGWIRGNRDLCAAVTLQMERSRALLGASREIVQVIGRLRSELGDAL